MTNYRALLASSLLLAAPTSQAVVITYQFDGGISVGMPHPSQPVQIKSANTPFIGTFSFDNSAPAITTTAESASYPLIDLKITFDPGTPGEESVHLLGGSIDVIDRTMFGDGLNINAGLASSPVSTTLSGFPLDFEGISLFYEDTSMSIFNNTAAPGANLTAADFSSPGSYVFSYADAGDTNFFLADGNLDNLSAVPEPSSFALLLGVLFAGALRRKRH